MLLRRCLWFALALAFALWAVPSHADEEAPVAIVAHIKLTGVLDETPTTIDPLLGIQPENFKSKLERIQAAKKDDKVKALYLQIEGVGIGWGKFHDLQAVLRDFRQSGKKIYAALDEGTTMDYLIAAACDEVVMPEGGWLLLTGLRAEMSFYKDLFEKIGLKADMLQMGDFKGAAEPYTRNSMSPELRRQLELVLDDYYDYLIGLIAQARQHKGLTPEKVKQLLDEGPFTARQALRAGLIDRVAYADQFEDAIKADLKAAKLTIQKDYGKKKAKDIDLSNPFALLKLLSTPKEPKLSSKPKVAVIYATGVIVPGKGGGSLFGGQECGATTIIEAIRKAEAEPTVKALVLRVDSPGGSALASDLIWNAVVRCKKPVIASMSDTAASGGYYISMGCRTIYAEPGTLTGSIGVVGGKFVTGGTWELVGVKTEVINRGRNAGILSPNAPFTDAERKVMTALMQEIYDQFLDKALAGRKRAGKTMSRADLEKLAGGRIWTGRQAKANGLIDELGTLDDAIKAAKQMAGLGADEEVELYILPKPRTFLDTLLEGADASAPPVQPQGMLFGELKAVPELAGHLRAAAGLLRLRGEPVWMVLPYRFEVK
jgi:protease-4